MAFVLLLMRLHHWFHLQFEDATFLHLFSWAAQPVTFYSVLMHRFFLHQMESLALFHVELHLAQCSDFSVSSRTLSPNVRYVCLCYQCGVSFKFCLMIQVNGEDAQRLDFTVCPATLHVLTGNVRSLNTFKGYCIHCSASSTKPVVSSHSTVWSGHWSVICLL